MALSECTPDSFPVRQFYGHNGDDTNGGFLAHSGCTPSYDTPEQGRGNYNASNVDASCHNTGSKWDTNWKHIHSTPSKEDNMQCVHTISFEWIVYIGMYNKFLTHVDGENMQFVHMARSNWSMYIGMNIFTLACKVSLARVIYE